MTPSTQDARATGLVELAVRCEQATVADRELNHDIYMRADAANGSFDARYTASLDAARSLIGKNAFWRLGNDGEGPEVSAFKATVTSGDGPTLAFHDAVAATPALALAAAALRALAASTKDQNDDG
jgi:hypothetical protein